MTQGKSSWQMRPPKINLSCSGRPQQGWRWKLFFTFESETQGPFSLPALYDGICSLIPSSGNRWSLLRYTYPGMRWVLVTGLHVEIVQHVGYFTNGVRETKMSMQLVHKLVPVREPVLKDALVFLVEAHLKPILGYSSKIGHCKVDFHNVHVKLHQISTEVQTVLEQEIIELVRLSATESIRDVGFSSP